MLLKRRNILTNNSLFRNTAIPRLTWFSLEWFLGMHNTLQNMILLCYWIFSFNTCMTWFSASNRIFSCHKNHIRWGIDVYFSSKNTSLFIKSGLVIFIGVTDPFSKWNFCNFKNQLLIILLPIYIPKNGEGEGPLAPPPPI